MTKLFQLLRHLTLAVGISAATAASGAESIPKPFVVAPDCTSEQLASLSAVAGIEATPIACYAFEKWSFKGPGIAYELQPDTTLSPDGFRTLRRTVFRDQSARLRTQRDLREAMPDQPPAHSTIPMSLLVGVRTPLGGLRRHFRLHRVRRSRASFPWHVCQHTCSHIPPHSTRGVGPARLQTCSSCTTQPDHGYHHGC
jgi:hypothetical protein